jgi:hypothetical protein
MKAHVIPAVRGFDATLRIETEANDGPLLTNEQIETLRQSALTGHASDAYMVSMPMGTLERIIATLTHQAVAKRYAATSVDVDFGRLTIRIAPERLVPNAPIVGDMLEVAIDGKMLPVGSLTLRVKTGEVVEFDVEAVPIETESTLSDGTEILALGRAPVGASEGAES